MKAYLARVDITLKPVVNDPQGNTIRDALHSLGFGAVNSVRTGKYMEIRVEAASKKKAEEGITEMCKKLLANPVIEDFRFEIDEVKG
ncbi:MAG TPA: phosphoribosylformylglycinamidine synthase subunit PurS [Dehalococcoidia bacterium]|nr:phosphoribosylformylglycinamidine synthase subunit PurS [Dehalococcoidia bacterium]